MVGPWPRDLFSWLPRDVNSFTVSREWGDFLFANPVPILVFTLSPGFPGKTLVPGPTPRPAFSEVVNRTLPIPKPEKKKWSGFRLLYPSTARIASRVTGSMNPFSVMSPAMSRAGVTSKAGL
jgi:hypothetical protein